MQVMFSPIGSRTPSAVLKVHPAEHFAATIATFAQAV
jgi:hypothetical protein